MELREIIVLSPDEPCGVIRLLTKELVRNILRLSAFVILNAAKNLTCVTEILRRDQRL
jgi:hypothetical protein